MSRRGKAHRPGPSEVRGMPADDSLEVITRYRTLLGALSVPAECFDPKFYLAGGLQPKAFAKLLRVIPEFEKLARMEQLFYIGVSRRLFPSVRGMKPQQFYDFLHYLKTPQGQDEVNKIQLAIKFEKRGGGYFEPHQVGKIAMIEAQRGDCITECNDLRRDYDARIAQQELLLRKLRAEKDDAIHAVTTKYRPFADISVLPVAEFNKLCWEEYLDNCRIEGHRPKSLNTENLEEAVHAYSDIVRQRHILNELLVGNRQEELERWVAAKIGRFDVERETKKARRFRGLLEAVGSGLLDAIPAYREASANESNSSGEAEASAGQGVFETVDTGDNLRGTTAETPDVAQAQTDDNPPDRTEPVQPPAPVQQQPLAIVEATQPHRQARYPSRSK
ncbi:TPA_asm: hypothetical protein [Phalaenopsis equestris amalgavirus 2]|nr:TPA_asm: hypothetical protein [Phalaenopsis equestris amalgavirus 2]